MSHEKDSSGLDSLESSILKSGILESNTLDLGTLESNTLKGVLILAGGLSTRMGSPKALLTLPTRKTLLDYHMQQADMLNVPMMIADNEQGFTSTVKTDNPVFYIKDYQPIPTSTPILDAQSATQKTSKPKHSAGPLSAILSGMQKALNLSKSTPNSKLEDGWILVISCDSLVNAKQAWGCLNRYKELSTHNELNTHNQPSKKVICFSSDKHLYPLLGLYRLDLADDLQRYLDSGQRRVMVFIKSFCQPVPLPEDWQALSNLNTPQDFARACQLAF